MQSSKHLQEKSAKITDINQKAKPNVLEQKDVNNFPLDWGNLEKKKDVPV